MAKRRPHIDTTARKQVALPLKYQIIKDHSVQLSHAMAEGLINLKTFLGERDVADSHVQTLYDEYMRGQFLWGNVTIATARIAGTNDVYHINGQHTCWMRLSVPAADVTKVRWIDYEVPDEENLRKLYGVYDRGKPRSHGHVVKAMLVGTPNMTGVWPSSINNLTAGFRLWKWEKRDDQTRNNAHELVGVIQQNYSVLFAAVATFWQTYEQHHHLKRSPVYAAMFATFDLVPTIAADFWKPIAEGLGFTGHTDPRYRLRECLIHTQLSRGGAPDKRTMDSEEMYRICISCWNKWRNGEQMNSAPRTTTRRCAPR